MNVSESLRQRFAALESDWENDAQHDQFVMQCFAEDVPAFAAACYREKGNDPRARRQLDRITTRLLLTMEASRSTSETGHAKPSRMGLPILIVLLLLALVALALLFSARP
jgi:hypothetical protein